MEHLLNNHLLADNLVLNYGEGGKLGSSNGERKRQVNIKSYFKSKSKLNSLGKFKGEAED